MVGFLIHLSTLSCSCVSSTGAMVSPVIEVLSSAALGEGCLWGVSVRQGWGVVLVVRSAMVLLLRQVLFSCIMSVVVCLSVFMAGLLRRIHA